IPQGDFAFRFDAGKIQSALIPNGSDGRLALVHESDPKKRVALHGIAEGTAMLAGFCNFLKLADGFVDQTHFAESNAEVVVRLEIFVFGAHFAKFGAEFVEDFLEWAGLDGGSRFGLGLGRSAFDRSLWRWGRGSLRCVAQSAEAELIDFV